MSRGQLTTTSFAILGLLAVQPWSTYELTRQMDRSLGRLWPRAQSKLYEEPKKLVEHGLAEASTERVGKRPRTVYSLTAKGLEALRAYAAEPVAFTPLKSDALLRLLIADLVGEAPTREALVALRAELAELAGQVDAAEESAKGLTHREKYLLLVTGFLRGVLDLHEELIAEVERELDGDS